MGGCHRQRPATAVAAVRRRAEALQAGSAAAAASCRAHSSVSHSSAAASGRPQPSQPNPGALPGAWRRPAAAPGRPRQARPALPPPAAASPARLMETSGHLRTAGWRPRRAGPARRAARRRRWPAARRPRPRCSLRPPPVEVGIEGEIGCGGEQDAARACTQRAASDARQPAAVRHAQRTGSGPRGACTAAARYAATMWGSRLAAASAERMRWWLIQPRACCCCCTRRSGARCWVAMRQHLLCKLRQQIPSAAHPMNANG